jgi:signal peptidase I
VRKALAALALTAALDLATSASWPPVVTVLTDSMAPAVGEGDAVLLARPHRLSVGDVVRVQVPEAGRRLGYPATVVHRIVGQHDDGTFRIQGDAKPDPDPFPVSRDDVDGRMVATVPGVGRVLRAALSPFVVLWLGLGAGLLLALPLLEQHWQRQALEAQRAVQPPSTTTV